MFSPNYILNFILNLDYGFQLPINHSSIWFRGAAGVGIGDRNNPFANFYFGGFGNNYIDYQAEKGSENIIVFQA